jgi:hypothetical protein
MEQHAAMIVVDDGDDARIQAKGRAGQQDVVVHSLNQKKAEMPLYCWRLSL